MPCGSRARLTAYVAYQSLAFADRDVLLAALDQAAFAHVHTAPVDIELRNPVPVYDAGGRQVASAALVVGHQDLPTGFGDLGFVVRDGAYVPLVPSDARAERVLQRLRTEYGRAKAAQLAEQARRRYQGSVQRTVGADGTVTIRVRI